MSGAVRARAARVAAVVLSGVTLAWLGGCTAIGGIAGGVAAVGSGSATGNPAVGVAVGIAVKASVDEALKTYSRRLSDAEQVRIATAIGEMDIGETRPWKIEHFIPFSGSSGEVTLLRTYDTALAPCREALFRVWAGNDKTPDARAFVVTACEASDGWRWAVAEPSVFRWGALQ